MIELRKITEENFNQCVQLQPHEEQKRFVASNVYSLAESYLSLVNNYCIPMPFAIYKDGTIIGFTLLSFNKADVDDEDDEDAYHVWRFMIDYRYQGKGYGKEAMEKIIDFILTYPHGNASVIFLSYDPDNDVARKLYASFGFVETGEIEHGELIAIKNI